MCIPVTQVVVRKSKNCYYENPYFVTGEIKLEGLECTSKDISKDIVVGMWEATERRLYGDDE